MKSTTVLIPTYNRAEALAVTVTSLCFQSDKDFDVIISDQSEENILEKLKELNVKVLEIKA